MVAALPVLMAYSLVGELLHEIAGTVMLALFVAHHILNRKATAAMFRGRQTPERVFSTGVNLLLFLITVLLPLSGIVMSKHLYTFLPTKGLSAIARTVHLLTSYWGFALMSLHLGLHLRRMFLPLRQRKALLIALFCAFTLLAGYGAYAFVSRGLWAYMTLQNQFVYFDFDEPRILFFLDTLSIIAAFAWIGNTIQTVLHRIGGKHHG